MFNVSLARSLTAERAMIGIFSDAGFDLGRVTIVFNGIFVDMI